MNRTIRFSFIYLLAIAYANPAFCMLSLKPKKTKELSDDAFLQQVGHDPFAHLTKSPSAICRLKQIAEKTENPTLHLVADMAKTPNPEYIAQHLVGNKPEDIHTFYQTPVVDGLVRVADMQTILENTTMKPGQAFTLDPYDFDTCKTICKTGRSDISASIPFYNRIALLPEDIRSTYVQKVFVDRTLLQKLGHVTVTTASTALATAACAGGYTMILGDRPSCETWVLGSLTSASHAPHNPRFNRFSDEIKESINADALVTTVPTLKSSISSWTMLGSSSTENAIVDGFTEQVLDYAERNKSELSTLVVNEAYNHSVDFLKKWYVQPCLASCQTSAIYGFGWGTVAGLVHGLSTMNQPLIETHIAAIGKAQKSSKLNHVAKCAVTGGIVGALGRVYTAAAENKEINSLVADLRTTGSPQSLIKNAIQSGEIALTSPETTTALTTSVENSIDQSEVNQLKYYTTAAFFLSEAVDSLGSPAEKSKGGTYKGDRTDTSLQSDVSRLMGNQVKAGSESYANIMVNAIQTNAINHSTTRLTPMVSQLIAASQRGLMEGIASGIVFGVMTMNDNASKE